METSILEKYSNKVLHHFLTELVKELDGDTSPSFDESFLSICDTVTSKFGMEQLSIIDGNYILSLLKINRHTLSQPYSTDLDFRRPKLITYEFDEDVFTDELVRTTYRNTMGSYDKGLVSETIELFVNDGSHYPWDGDEIDRDVIDSSTNDIKLDKDSIRALKQR